MTTPRSERTVGGVEIAAWIALAGVALFLRLWDLGTRVMSHDESIHSFYAYELLRRGTYVHDPVYHGPLLYHLNALVFFFFGASDATARLSSAIAGLGLVVSMWLFRPLLGRVGAFCAALLVALSPALLFYSRQVWMDVHVALFTVLWIYGAFRYLRGRGRRWLYLVTGAMALSFVAKEVSFIFGAIIGVWLVVEAFAARRADPTRAVAAGDLAVLMLALVAPFASGASYLAMGWGVREAHAPGFALMAAHFAVSILLVWAWTRTRSRLVAPARAPGAATGSAAAVAAATSPSPSPLPLAEPAARAPSGVGIAAAARGSTPARQGLRLRDGALCMTLFWGLAILLFTTFFTNLRGGLVSGIVGSLGYWLTQHEVARGSQPWFYYLLLAVLYEVLPLVVGGLALLAGAWHLRRSAWDPAAHDVPAAVPAAAPAAAGFAGAAPSDEATLDRGDRRSFFSFVLWWTLASWCAYLLAGEKMPWLLTHMVLPLTMVAGWGVGRLAVYAARARSWRGALVLVGGGVVGPALVARWIAAEPFTGATQQAVAETLEWFVRGAVILAVLTLMARAAWQVGARQAGRLVALGLCGLLFALTVRAGLRLCYLNYDLATEHLSYAQGSPDVKRAMREIQLISERSAGDQQLFVAYDDQSSWPFVWYFRHYPKARTFGTQPQFAQGAAVILTGPKNRDGVWPLVASGYVKREYRLIWWPRQDYASMGLRDFVTLLRDPERRRTLWRMAMHHDYSHFDSVKWDPRQEFDMYVREDVAPLGLATYGGAGDLGGAGVSAAPAAAVASTGTQLAPTPSAILAGTYDGLALLHPTEIAIAPDGARVIADGGNHRVVVLERDGSLRRAFGSRCDMGQGAATGCVDPDGPGPLETGDGQLNEPWGVAVGAGGEILVSDTWNHRVVRFGADGGFERKWGRFGNAPIAGAADAAPEPVFYGPRGIAFGLHDDLVVADTGNKRLVLFSPAGDLLRSLGGGGVGLEHYDEPVGVAVDADNGTLLVADAWNQRIKRLDRRYQTLGAWRVPGWRSEDVSDKPFVEVDAVGGVWASDPDGGRIWMFDASGRLVWTIVLPPIEGGKPRPLGLAIDGATRELLVVDHAGGRVLVYPLPDPAASRLPS